MHFSAKRGIAIPYDLPFPQNGGSICPQHTLMAISLQRVIRSTLCLVLFTIRTNPRWRPTPCWKNFKWRYLRNRLSDPLHFLLYGGVFGDSGSNGSISGSNKSKMAAAAILEKFQMAIYPQPVVYLCNGSRSTYIARIARSSLQ